MPVMPRRRYPRWQAWRPWPAMTSAALVGWTLKGHGLWSSRIGNPNIYHRCRYLVGGFNPMSSSVGAEQPMLVLWKFVSKWRNYPELNVWDGKHLWFEVSSGKLWAGSGLWLGSTHQLSSIGHVKKCWCIPPWIWASIHIMEIHGSDEGVRGWLAIEMGDILPFK